MGRARFRFRLLWFVFQSGGGEDLGQLSAAIAPIALIFLKIEARPLTAVIDRNGLVPRAHDRLEFGDRGVSTLPPAKRPSIRMPRGKSDSARSSLHALRPLVQISGEAVHVFEQPFEALRYPCELAL